ncbi:MAG: N-acetylglucosamine-6-phosphate deacetylase [Chloroflexi bacterium]|nr:N-acetylglucosamine-6-phosphate deacetylase [Chloroflexota bacterium]
MASTPARRRYVVAGGVVGAGDGTAIGFVLHGARIERLLHVGDAIAPDDGVLDFRPHTLAPGTIDVHTHGGAGCSFSAGPEDDTRQICRYRASTGTTGLLATITGTWDELMAALPKLRRLAEQPVDGAALLGIHVEGPFVNPVRKGAISPETMRLPSVDDLRRLHDAAGGAIKMMTVAPELPGAFPVIERMVTLGIVPSVGHSDASYEQVIDAVTSGVRKSTHTYNAMRPLLHRDPGTVGGILADDRVFAELIADGVHVHAGAMKVLLNAKGVRRTVLVTDGVRYAGLPEGIYERPGRGRLRIGNGVAITDDGTIAGSVSPLNRNLCLLRDELGVPLEDLFTMAAAVPADLLELATKGGLTPGADADFAAYDAGLTCLATFVAGQQVYRAP